MLSQLRESQIIPLMIEGLPQEMAEYFITVRPKTFIEFYEISQRIEENIKRKGLNKYRTDNFIRKGEFQNSEYKKRPPNACQICESLGFKNRFHWAQECRNKQKSFQNKKKVTLTETNNEQDEAEMDISEELRNIHLN